MNGDLVAVLEGAARRAGGAERRALASWARVERVLWSLRVLRGKA